MVGWHHRFDGQNLGQTPGDSEGRETGMLQSVRSQRVQNLATEQQIVLLRNFTDTKLNVCI